METILLYCNGCLITVTKCKEYELNSILSQFARKCKEDYDDIPLSISYSKLPFQTL